MFMLVQLTQTQTSNLSVSYAYYDKHRAWLVSELELATVSDEHIMGQACDRIDLDTVGHGS